MSIASLIRKMADAGASPEAIAIAVEAIEAVQSEQAERRAKDAERKRRSRSKDVSSTDNNVTVTGQSEDGHGNVSDPLPPCPPSFPPDPQTTPLNPPTPCRADEDFERFWKAYPSRDGANPKKPAKAKFERIVKRGLSPEVLILSAEQYRRGLERDGKIGTAFVAQAQTWLNQERWNDDLPPSKSPDPPEFPAMAAMLKDPDADVTELLAIKENQGDAAAERYAAQTHHPETVQ